MPDTDFVAAAASLDWVLAGSMRGHIDTKREVEEAGKPKFVDTMVGVDIDIEAEQMVAEGKTVAFEEGAVGGTDTKVAVEASVGRQVVVIAKRGLSSLCWS